MNLVSPSVAAATGLLPGYATAVCEPPAMPEASLPSGVIADVQDFGRSAPMVFEDKEPAGMRSGELERQVAFQAAPFSWQGKQLDPFAIDREGDWLIHRALIGAPPLSVVFSQGSAFLPDACRILFMCANEPETWLADQVTPLEAFQGVSLSSEERAQRLEKRIRQWSVDNIPPGTQTEATTLAVKIYNRAHETRAVPQPQKTGEGKSAGN